MSIKISTINTNRFMSLISKRQPSFVSDNSLFFYLDREPGFSSGILKIYNFKNLPQVLMPIYQNIWPREILDGSRLGFDEFIKVLELIVVDDMFRGHISEPVDSSYINFDDYIRRNIDINYITEVFKKLNVLLEKGIKHDVAFPDIMTAGNLKIDPRTNRLKVFDLEGLQVNKNFSFTASDLLAIEENEQFSKLYMRFTSRGPYLDLMVNRAIFIIYYIKSLTNVCLPLALPSEVPSNISTDMILNAIGLNNDDLLAPFIRQTMITGNISEISNGLLDEFSKKYTLKKTMYADTEGMMFKKR